MRFNPKARLDPSQVGSSGGSGGRGRGPVIAGGGVGSILLIVLALIFGPDILSGGDGSTTDPFGTGSSGYVSTSDTSHCTTGADIASDRDCRFVAYTNSIQAFWTTQFEAGQYQTIQVQPFTGSISTGCGTASSAVGPFYCPNDTTVYLDYGFFDELSSTLGARGGDAAEAYVIAHEFGHHVQNLTGTMARVQRQGDNQGAQSGSVRLELQADCYAGVWLRHATDDPNGPIAEITDDDLARAVDAAESVGDDRIQKKAQGTVTPETWTHGSSAWRHEWLQTGYDSGDPNSCNTFAGSLS